MNTPTTTPIIGEPGSRRNRIVAIVVVIVALSWGGFALFQALTGPDGCDTDSGKCAELHPPLPTIPEKDTFEEESISPKCEFDPTLCDPIEEAGDGYRDDQHREWCQSIYEQNVGCPLYGQVEIPQDVLDQQEADHLDWCDSIYHRNVSCPLHGQVEVPQDVLDQEEAEHLEWCDSIDHRNVGCPEYELRHGNDEEAIWDEACGEINPYGELGMVDFHMMDLDNPRADLCWDPLFVADILRLFGDRGYPGYETWAGMTDDEILNEAAYMYVHLDLWGATVELLMATLEKDPNFGSDEESMSA